MTTALTLAEIAAQLGRDPEGDSNVRISGVAALERAGPEDVAFARSARHASAASSSRAGALILPDGIDVGARPLIRSPNPALDFARAVALLVPDPPAVPGIDPLARVAEDARVDGSASLAAGAVVGSRSRVGARSVLHPHAVLYSDVAVGADCVIHSGVVLREGTVLGDRVVLHAGVVVGADGFGYIADEEGRLRHVPQVGRVVIEDDVEIGANTTIDRATLHETRIRRGAKIDNLVQIAHNCEIGEQAIVVAQTGLSGSTSVGAGALIMAQVGSAGHLRIGDRAFVGARAGLHRDVSSEARVFGSPQQEQGHWHRTIAALRRLPDLMRRLRAVERELGLRAARNGDADAEAVASPASAPAVEQEGESPEAK